MRLNFQASAERIARLEDESGFKNLATSARKKNPHACSKLKPDRSGRSKSANCSALPPKATMESCLWTEGIPELNSSKLTASVTCICAPELKAVISAMGERDENAVICLDHDGRPEPDADLRDTETVPLKESIEEYFKREVLPHVKDAWIDTTKTKVGYEIPLNRHFYRYEPPRPLEIIETDIKSLEENIMKMLKEVTA